VHDHVGARRILHASARAPAVGPLRSCRCFGEPRPQRTPGRLFCLETDRPDEAIAIVGVAVVEVHRVQHAVAVERVVRPDRLVDRVLSVAEIHADQIVGNRAGHVEVERVVLDLVRAPRARSVGMVVVGRQCRTHPVDHFDASGSPSRAPWFEASAPKRLRRRAIFGLLARRGGEAYRGLSFLGVQLRRTTGTRSWIGGLRGLIWRQRAMIGQPTGFSVRVAAVRLCDERRGVRPCDHDRI